MSTNLDIAIGFSNKEWKKPNTRETTYRRRIPAQKRQYHTMETSAGLSQSMHHITTTKLAALSKQQQRYETDKARILQTVANESKVGKKVKYLLDAYEFCNIPVPTSISLANIRRFLEQSDHDPTVSPVLLQEWQTTLEKALDIPSNKYKHASLFGRLVMEWLGEAKQSPTTSIGYVLSGP